MKDEQGHKEFTAADIQQYWQGTLTARQMHELEKAAMNDPLLADALEGYRSAGPAVASRSGELEDLQARLQQRIGSPRKTRLIPFGLPAIKWAASLLVLAGGTWLYIQLRNQPREATLAAREKVLRKDSAAPPESRATLSPLDSGKDLALDRSSSTRAAAKPGTVIHPSGRAEKIDSLEVITQSLVDNSGGRKAPGEPAPVTERLKSSKAPENESKVVFNDKEEVIRMEKPVFAFKADRDSLKLHNNQVVASKVAYINTFSGYVVNAQNQPVPGAQIIGPAQKFNTHADNYGYFTLKASDSLLDVSVASLGYSAARATLNKDLGQPVVNKIVLQPTGSELDEVVVTGYASKKRKAFVQANAQAPTPDYLIYAMPQGGWKAFNEYLEKNRKVPEEAADIHGVVLLSFEVDSRGYRKSYRIEKSLDESLDAEALRLVKEGPSWLLLKGKKQRVQVTVPF